ncbi:MAG: hypothetical protein KC502_12415 [Myxococcales bacterium]|nr:hypothetical protein [Myxococcales bacterium]
MRFHLAHTRCDADIAAALCDPLSAAGNVTPLAAPSLMGPSWSQLERMLVDCNGLFVLWTDSAAVHTELLELISLAVRRGVLVVMVRANGDGPRIPVGHRSLEFEDAPAFVASVSKMVALLRRRAREANVGRSPKLPKLPPPRRAGGGRRRQRLSTLMGTGAPFATALSTAGG